MSDDESKVVVVSGGTDGMGRATALARLAHGDHVTVIGSNEAKGRALEAEARRRESPGRLRFVRADLSVVAENRRVAALVADTTPVVDALLLFANRPRPHRVETTDGFEYTFALYYLSRHLLGEELRPLLEAAHRPVIVSVAGVGVTAGAIHWDDPQLTRGYGPVKAQLQAGRANDLLGVSYAERYGGVVPYVMYHPGFTRSGDLSTLPAPARWVIRVLGAVAARPVARSAAPVVDWVDAPPRDALTAIDRGRRLPSTLKTLDPADARRLAAMTADLLSRLSTGGPVIHRRPRPCWTHRARRT
ncbi:SDR family NAD(P)-dependent oxidoreductase [Stackebrandtia albiflava]|nr:SDR family NAD(P)-dependent oxidoreductase [Stackebrandtia albiflava]